MRFFLTLDSMREPSLVPFSRAVRAGLFDNNDRDALRFLIFRRAALRGRTPARLLTYFCKTWRDDHPHVTAGDEDAAVRDLDQLRRAELLDDVEVMSSDPKATAAIQTVLAKWSSH